MLEVSRRKLNAGEDGYSAGDETVWKGSGGWDRCARIRFPASVRQSWCWQPVSGTEQPGTLDYLRIFRNPGYCRELRGFRCRRLCRRFRSFRDYRKFRKIHR
eukprot:gene9742-biopygen1910